MLPPPQGLSHIVPPKNVDVQRSHYIVPGVSLDYSAANLHIWDPMQIPTNVQNGQENNNKKVNTKFPNVNKIHICE